MSTTILPTSVAAKPTTPRKAAKPLQTPIIERVTKRDCRFLKRDFTHEDPLATLMLMQMLADVYEDRRVVLEVKEKDRKAGAALAAQDHLELNDNQKKIEEFLMRTGFLSRPEPPEPSPTPEPTALPQVIEIGDAPKGIAPLSSTKRLLAWSKATPRKLPTKFVPKNILRILQKHIAPTKRCQPKPRMTLPKAKHTPTPVYRPVGYATSHQRIGHFLTCTVTQARPALPRIVPSIKPRLRRMSSDDSRALLISSARFGQKRIPRPIMGRALQPAVESHISPQPNNGPKNDELKVCARTKASSSPMVVVPIFVPDEDDVDLPVMPEAPSPGQIISFYLMTVVFFFVDLALNLLFNVSTYVLRAVWKVLWAMLCIVFYFPDDNELRPPIV
ncbi:hypothetical protein DXG03_003418 [Asterophora parasitica]|uniref:Uncharacterized protein n=1 Tax=Asterophora parasitica TaxID=117018 RepID=A0A9P7G7P0_9AGAR|nr:hypothetical protein DXG03_003418 [Asterophora parasitica]